MPWRVAWLPADRREARKGDVGDLDEPLIATDEADGAEVVSDDDCAAAAQSGAGGGGHAPRSTKCTLFATTSALLTLQLGWGLWLLPCDFARLGWSGGFGGWVGGNGVRPCARLGGCRLWRCRQPSCPWCTYDTPA